MLLPNLFFFTQLDDNPRDVKAVCETEKRNTVFIYFLFPQYFCIVYDFSLVSDSVTQINILITVIVSDSCLATLRHAWRWHELMSNYVV